MSRLEELIQELCPTGVEYKTLGDIATDIFRGAGITRDQVCEKGTPCVRYGEIYTTYGIWFDKCVSYTDETALTTKKYFEYGDILFAITGESVEDIAKSCAYVGQERCLAGGDIVALKHNENPRYLAYALSTTEAQMQKSKGKVKSKVVHSSIPAIQAIRIPVPPLPVQREIVRILDKYSEEVVVLKETLSAELTARKKQYEYYRNELLSFKNEHIDWLTLNDIFDIRNGYTPSKKESSYWEGGTIPWFRLEDIRNNGRVLTDSIQHITPLGVKKSGLFNKDSIMMSTTATLGEHAIIKIPYMSNQQITNLTIKKIFEKKIIPKFAFYYCFVIGKRCCEVANYSGGIPIVDQNKFKKLSFPVPPIEEQQRIVAILDRFDTLCNDILNGLPAEIEARQKQYEYYRDKLLTFKEKTS